VATRINITGFNEQHNGNKTETRSTQFDTNTYMCNSGVLSDKEILLK